MTLPKISALKRRKPNKTKPPLRITDPTTALKRLRKAEGTLERHPNGDIRATCENDPDAAAWIMAYPAQVHDIVRPQVNPEGRQRVDAVLKPFDVVYVPADKAQDHIERILSEAQDTGVICFDTETMPLPEYVSFIEVKLTLKGTPAVYQPKTGDAGAALDPLRARPRLLSVFTGGSDTIYVFDALNGGWDVLSELFRKAPSLAAHNAKFDLRMLAREGIEPDCRVYDTMSACTLLTGQTKIGLAQACKDHLGVTIPKGLGASDWSTDELSEDQIRYAALDAVLAYEVWAVQRREFDAQAETVQDLFDEVLPAVSRMESNGLLLDRDLHAQKTRDWETERDACAARLVQETNGHLISDRPTPAQIAAYIEATVPNDVLHKWPRTKTRKLITGKDILKQHERVLPGASTLRLLRTWQKALSNYGQPLADIAGADDRVRASYWIAGANTGRSSSSGPNIQNQPKRNPLLSGYRDIFCAPEGHVLITADFSQIELRILAEISGDEDLRKAFAEGADIHTQTARAVTGKTDVDKHDRSLAKALNFGLSFGMGPAGFRDYAANGYGVHLSLDEAGQARDAFFDAYIGVRDWQRTHAAECRQLGYVETRLGRRWYWQWGVSAHTDRDIEAMSEYQRRDALNGFSFTKALNMPIQGTAAELMHRATIKTDAALSGSDVLLCAVIHDELVLQAPTDVDLVKRTIAVVEQAMHDAWRETFPDAPSTELVEATVGPTWGTQYSVDDWLAQITPEQEDA
ncbi:DNA polymerase [Ruegeria sp. HKCCA5491]|uniref:DNA polymerase n=1 Tax=Ruegeria sp. HKCCA5491 TaxID=2682986 RepID=UPI001488926C|nr:DNA polymerase [Ruegeria sp. HKCCA5491]